jgi:hypothetical protein
VSNEDKGDWRFAVRAYAVAEFERAGDKIGFVNRGFAWRLEYWFLDWLGLAYVHWNVSWINRYWRYLLTFIHRRDNNIHLPSHFVQKLFHSYLLRSLRWWQLIWHLQRLFVRVRSGVCR